MELELIQNEEEVRKVSIERNYWFVRTFTGELYEDFVENNFIGFGINDIRLSELAESRLDDENSVARIRNRLSESKTYNLKEALKWAKQLITFYSEMKIGDIVLIPDKNSSELSIGEIISEPFEEEVNRTVNFKDNYIAYPNKRRSIDWKVRKSRSGFNSDLGTTFFTRLAITKINDLKEIIEGQISSLFLIGDTSHLVISIKQDEDINAVDLNNFLSSMIFFYKDINSVYNIDASDDLYIKIKVQSKGKIALKATQIMGVLGLATIFALSNNPQIKLQLTDTIKFEGSSDGLLQSWSDFLNEKLERKKKYLQFLDSTEKLKASAKNESLEEDVTDDSQEQREEDEG